MLGKNKHKNVLNYYTKRAYRHTVYKISNECTYLQCSFDNKHTIDYGTDEKNDVINRN